jgi:hypothetical protein
MLVAVLRCIECARTNHGSSRRWRAYLTVDGLVAVYCPRRDWRYRPGAAPERFLLNGIKSVDCASDRTG